MKATLLVLLAPLLLNGSTYAQSTPEASNPTSVTILKKSWEKRIPPSRDSLVRNTELMDQTRKEKAVIKRRDNSLPNQPTEEPMPVPRPRPLVSPAQLEANTLYI